MAGKPQEIVSMTEISIHYQLSDSGRFKRFSATAVKVHCFDGFFFVGESPINLICEFNKIHLKFPLAMT
jgi:hypothetical protein